MKRWGRWRLNESSTIYSFRIGYSGFKRLFGHGPIETLFIVISNISTKKFVGVNWRRCVWIWRCITLAFTEKIFNFWYTSPSWTAKWHRILRLQIPLHFPKSLSPIVHWFGRMRKKLHPLSFTPDCCKNWLFLQYSLFTWYIWYNLKLLNHGIHWIWDWNHALLLLLLSTIIWRICFPPSP